KNGLKTKPLCGAFAEPSDGLEPWTPSLPSTSRRNTCLCGFEGRPICRCLPPVATTGLHKGSIRGSADVARSNSDELGDDLLAAGTDETGLVGVDHGLHAVAQVELLEDASDVRLRGCRADDEWLADL